MTKTPSGIIFGLDKELRRYLGRLNCAATSKVAGLDFIEGELAGVHVVLVNAGIGKVNAAIATTILCRQFDCGLIIFPGLAGGLASGIQAGDLVVATELVQHDHGNWINGKFEPTRPCPPPSLPKAGNGFFISPTVEQIVRKAALGLGRRPDTESIKVHFGRVISGDIFVDCATTREQLFRTYNALAIDMEGGAIAQVTERFGRDHLVIRVIGDLAGAAHKLSSQAKLDRLDVAADLVLSVLTS